MNTHKCILVTGWSSHLGLNLISLLLFHNYELVLISNSSSLNDSYKKIKSYMSLKKFNKNLVNQRLKIYIGDVSKERLGLKVPDYKSLLETVDVIYHCAALTNFNQDIDKLREINLCGTINVATLAKEAKKKPLLNYVSSIFVCGDYKYSFKESSLRVGQKFNNNYERSKFEAEDFLKSNLKLKTIIHRPSIIWGDFSDGYSFNKGLLNQLFKLVSLKVFDSLYISNTTKLNIIPSDIAAQAIFLLSQNYKDKATYNIISPNSISLRSIVDRFCLLSGIKSPVYENVNKKKLNKLSSIQRRILKPFMPYFNLKVKLNSTLTANVLRTLGFSFPIINKKYLDLNIKFYNSRA
jgi:thioester reductase-like protein